MNLKPILLALFLSAPVALSTVAAEAPSVVVEMDAESYAAASTLLGDAPVANVVVADAEGAPVADAEVRVVFIRMLPGLGYATNETVIVRTGVDGTAAVPAPQFSGAPGEYTVIAFAMGAIDSDRYKVGA